MVSILETGAQGIRPGWTAWRVVIRVLWPHELEQFRQHLLRLDKTTRIERFGRAVSAEWLSGYCDETDLIHGVVLGCWVDGLLVGVGELRRYSPPWSPVAEVALTLERAWQNHGLGALLARRLLLSARNRGMATLHMLTQASNQRMLHILRRSGARMRFAGDQVELELVLRPATAASLAEEWMEESRARLLGARVF
jgi:RimJ/RimL family protein N-acetyltransferase